MSYNKYDRASRSLHMDQEFQFPAGNARDAIWDSTIDIVVM